MEYFWRDIVIALIVFGFFCPQGFGASCFRTSVVSRRIPKGWDLCGTGAGVVPERAGRTGLPVAGGISRLPTEVC